MFISKIDTKRLILLVFLKIIILCYKKQPLKYLKKMKTSKNFILQNKVTHTFTSCQWPYGDPQEKEFHFCGEKPFENKPYCKEHCNIAYIDEKELKKSRDNKPRKIAA